MKINRPNLHREQETRDVVRFMGHAGQEINTIAKKFNSGYGAAKELRRVSQLLANVYELIYALRKKGYLYA